MLEIEALLSLGEFTEIMHLHDICGLETFQIVICLGHDVGETGRHARTGRDRDLYAVPQLRCRDGGDERCVISRNHNAVGCMPNCCDQTTRRVVMLNGAVPRADKTYDARLRYF